MLSDRLKTYLTFHFYGLITHVAFSDNVTIRGGMTKLALAEEDLDMVLDEFIDMTPTFWSNKRWARTFLQEVSREITSHREETKAFILKIVQDLRDIAPESQQPNKEPLSA